MKIIKLTILAILAILILSGSVNANEVNQHKSLMDKQLVCYSLWFTERTGLKGSIHRGIAINLGATEDNVNEYAFKFVIKNVTTSNFQAKAKVHDEYRKMISELVDCDGADSEYWKLVSSGEIKHVNH